MIVRFLDTHFAEEQVGFGRSSESFIGIRFRVWEKS